MVKDAEDAGIEILTDTEYQSRRPDGSATAVTTSQGQILAGYVINAAGVYADKIAADFGFSRNYRVLPFKGLYLYADKGTEQVRTHIYPVPNLNNPFLGVHYTVTVDGRVKIGPTAIPAFWREHYRGFENFSFQELIEIVGRELTMFVRNDFQFRSLAFTEMQKYVKSKMVEQAEQLVTGTAKQNFRTWGKPGIRAQLFDIEKRRLEMDFRYEGDRKSFHVLNAVSPAFTCSMPFCTFLFDQIDQIAQAA
jgi:L-2-hydroxyglutarate oxidase LhgO